MTDDRPKIDAIAGEPLDSNDAQIIAQISQLYATVDPVPDGLIERLQFAITLDALHAEVAELQRWDAQALGARSAEDASTRATTITFTSSSLTTMITITPELGGRVRIDGWVAPGARAAIELRVTGATHHTRADADGRFVFEEVARGLAQFVVHPHDAGVHPPVITPSVEL